MTGRAGDAPQRFVPSLEFCQPGGENLLPFLPRGRAPRAVRPLPQGLSDPVRVVEPLEARLTTGAKAAGTDKSRDGKQSESMKEFEKRATESKDIKSTAGVADMALPEAGDDLSNASALEAIELYKKLLAKYPNYERNDQALYNMSRAYEELGQVEEAMKVMTRIVTQYPKSRYIDEVQFRRGEYFFTRKKFLDAEDAYKTIAATGPTSSFYELALYKLGWTFYKQDLYEDALHRFIGVLDYKVSTGYDFEKAHDEIEKRQIVRHVEREAVRRDPA